MQESKSHISYHGVVDEIDRARAQEYALLAILLSRSPDSEMIERLALLRGDASLLGAAHADLAEAHYLTGSLYGRPLARLRETFHHLGIERDRGHSEPEDHVAILCEIMASLIGGDLAVPPGADREFFEKHLARWIRRFFVDLENVKSADFYARVGALGRTFIDVETEAFALSA